MKDIWTLVSKCLARMSARSRIVLAIYGGTLIVLAGLDAAALFLLANSFGPQDAKALQDLALDTSATQLLLIVVLFTTRSILSTFVTWYATIQMAREESLIANYSFTFLLSPRTLLSETPATDFINSVDHGPRDLIAITLNFITACCEVITGAVVVGALVFFEPLTAALAFLYFLSVAMFQHSVLAKSSKRYGVTTAQIRSRVYQILTDAASLRWVLAPNGVRSLEYEMHKHRHRLARSQGMIGFIATVPRYFLELVFAIGLVLIGGATYVVVGASDAIAATTLFVAAGFRLLPIVNRVQSLFLYMVAIAPTARLALQRFLSPPPLLHEDPTGSRTIIELDSVVFSYPGFTTPVVSNVSLSLEMGRQYAIVGPSGAGKTTLAEILLGFNVPQLGVIRRHPEMKCSYVPQDTHIAVASLAQNIALTWDNSEIDLRRIGSVLEKVHLQEFQKFIHCSDPIDPSSLSGGEKQRLGLARALYADSNFIILDEITSSLDMETEQQIYETIAQLRDTATVVIIAHRLSTLKLADKIYYLNNGQIQDSGSFDELTRSSSEFRRQIEISQIDLHS